MNVYITGKISIWNCLTLNVLNYFCGMGCYIVRPLPDPLTRFSNVPFTNFQWNLGNFLFKQTYFFISTTIYCWIVVCVNASDIRHSLYKQHQYGWWIRTVYPKKYAHGFVVLCFVVVMQSFIMNSLEVFIHIHQGCFAGTGAIVRLPQCQRSKPDGYGKISQCITTRKHSKAKTVCIFLGIYCNTIGNDAHGHGTPWHNGYIGTTYIRIKTCRGLIIFLVCDNHVWLHIYVINLYMQSSETLN